MTRDDFQREIADDWLRIMHLIESPVVSWVRIEREMRKVAAKVAAGDAELAAMARTQ